MFHQERLIVQCKIEIHEESGSGIQAAWVFNGVALQSVRFVVVITLQVVGCTI